MNKSSTHVINWNRFSRFQTKPGDLWRYISQQLYTHEMFCIHTTHFYFTPIQPCLTGREPLRVSEYITHFHVASLPSPLILIYIIYGLDALVLLSIHIYIHIFMKIQHILTHKHTNTFLYLHFIFRKYLTNHFGAIKRYHLQMILTKMILLLKKTHTLRFLLHIHTYTQIHNFFYTYISNPRCTIQNLPTSLLGKY